MVIIDDVLIYIDDVLLRVATLQAENRRECEEVRHFHTRVYVRDKSIQTKCFMFLGLIHNLFIFLRSGSPPSITSPRGFT